MKRTTTRTAIAAAFSLGLATATNALPVYFDFTGTINGGTFDGLEGTGVGTPIMGGFTFETDRLFESSPPPPATLRSWIDWQPVNPAEPVAYLNFGSRNFAVPSGAGSNYALISFSDACPTTGCQSQQFENFGMFASSTDREVAPGFTGTYNTQSFYFASGIFLQPGLDYFDGAQVDPTSIASLPLHTMFGFYSEDTFDCVDGSCVNNGFRNFSFSIDSVSRGVGTRSVPEPGTLGLLGAGLLAVLLMRRRTLRQQQA